MSDPSGTTQGSASDVDEVYRLVDAEQYTRAQKLAEHAPRGEPRWTVARASLAVYTGDGELDDAILSLESLLRDEAPAVLPDHDRALAYALLVRAYGYKRAFAKADAWASRGRADVGAHVELVLAEARSALWRDDRDRAQALCDEARRIASESTIARYVSADLAYVAGDFEGCHATLASVPASSPDFLRASRLRAAAYAAVQDHQGELAMWEAVVEHGARGDRAADDRLSLAIALGSSGKRTEALEQLRDVWRRDPASSLGRYAFARIEALEAAIANPAEAPRKALTFPSTHQKHNYCGPAVLELCLRSLGIEIFQEEIASTVKGEHGTPMFAIVRYLHDHGVVARRIAATAARLKSAIDLGLPVILQEEYSTTSHVAVLTGYDAGLGLFITSDPATHRPTYKSFSWTEQAGELFGNGAVVVLGRVGPEAERMAEKCDAAGLVDEPHLAILDECDQRQAPGPLAGAEDAALHEVLLLAKRAIEIEPTFKLAWYRRWRALQGLHDRRRADETKSQLLETLFEIRTRFPGDEWPFQLHANWLMSGERFDEAFVQYMEASARDPEDANNVMDMGYCRALAGDLAASEKHLLRSLRLSAASPDTHVRMADVYLRQLEDDDAELSAADQRSRLVRDTTMVEHRIERSVEEISRRSGHFATLATELSPRDAYGHEVLGVLALRAERWADAMAAFEKAAELAPGRFRSRRGLAIACERMGDVARAEQLFTELCAAPDADAASWLTFAELLTRQGKREEAIAALSKGLLALEGQRSELVEPLFDLLREHESTEIAAAKLRDLSTRRPSDAAFQRTVAATLDGAGQRGHAVAVYRQSLAAAPTDLMTAFRLGKALSLSLATRDEALALLERVAELAPGWPHGCRELALLLADSDPERALAVLAPVLESEEPYTLEAHGLVLEKLGRTEEARRAYQRAIHANTEPATALIAYCDWHAYAHRFDRAVAIARTLVDADGNASVDEALRERAQRSWLSALRLAGRMTDALPAVLALVARNEEKVPLHLAHGIYWGTRTPRADLAARAAAALREAADDAKEKLEWKIREGTRRAKAGDPALLEEVAREVADTDAEGWAELVYAYAVNDRHAEADAAAARAYALAPDNHEALKAMEDRAVHQGRLDLALACAERLLELHPHEHAGPERLGILFAKMGRVDEAVSAAARAVDAAPYCHIAQRSAAVAYFAAGDFAKAAAYAKQSMAIEPPDEEDEGCDVLMILRAIQRDTAGLARCFVDLDESESPEIFAEFKKRLRDVAARA